MTNRQDPVRTEVFLRIEHDTAQPDVVTTTLGITPSHSVKCGQLPVGGRGEPYPWNVWVLSSGWAVHSKDVRVHFQWLLASISPRGSELRTLREQGHRMEIHGLWIGSGGYGGPELTPEILRGLANLGVNLYFDIGVIGRGTETNQEGEQSAR